MRTGFRPALLLGALTLPFLLGGLGIFYLSRSGGSDSGSPTLEAPIIRATTPPSPSPSPSPSPAPPALTLAGVFTPPDISALDPSHLRTVIATGDVIPARWTDKQIRARGNDFSYPFAATAEILKAGDITVVNLESPLVEGCPPQQAGSFTFCGQPGFAPAMQAAGVDVVTLENNHVGNYGRDGIDETEKHLEAAGLKWADRSTPAMVDVRGLRFGFLAFNGVEGHVDRQEMVAQIAALRPKVDVMAVAFHWGKEYVSLPEAAPGIADDNPVELAHLAVDAGADLIIGNHPHWVQAVELYKGKYIAYAHGNFIFDQMWSYETRVGVVGKYTFYDKTLVRVEYTPVLIENYAEPVPMQGTDAVAVLEGMKTASEQLAASLAPAPASATESAPSRSP